MWLQDSFGQRLSNTCLKMVFAVGGSFLALGLVLSLLTVIKPARILASPLPQPLFNGSQVVSKTAHTSNTTHEMSVFGNGRITDQFLVSLADTAKVNQIHGVVVSNTTIAIMFEPNDEIDVGVYGDFEVTIPITLHVPSKIAGYSEDTVAVYSNSGSSYQVTQRTFATDTNNAVIMELLIHNTGEGSLTGGKLLYAVDIDVGKLTGFDSGGYTETKRMVYQTDHNPDDEHGYAMGVALLAGNLRGYGVVDSNVYNYLNSRLEISKTLISPINPISFTMEDEHSNLISWLEADIPTILPNEATRLAFGLFANAISGTESAALDGVITAANSVIYPTPILTVTKATEPAEAVEAGGLLTYTIIISNIGYGSATGVIVSDTVPNHTQFVPDSISLDNPAGIGQTGTAPPILASGLTIPPGQSVTVTYAVTVTDSVPAGVDIVTNTVVITGDFDESVTNSVTTSVLAIPTLILFKTNFKLAVSPGESFPYHLTVKNMGTREALGVVLTDIIPANTIFIDASAPHTLIGNPVSKVMWGPFDLAAEETVMHNVQVSVVSPFPAGVDAITNTARVNENGNLISVQDEDKVNASSALSMSKTNEVMATKPGEILTYTLTITNTGNQNARGLILTDTLPASATFISASGGGLETFPGSGVVTWSVPNLSGEEASETRILTVQMNNPLPAGIETITNTATIADDSGVMANAEDIDGVIAAPDLSITKTDGQTEVSRGDVLTYTLTISNIGTQGTMGVVVTDVLPEHTNFVGASDGGSETVSGSGVISWPSFSLPAGEVVTRLVVVSLNTQLPPGLMAITNTAMVTDYNRNGLDLNPANNQDFDEDSLMLAPYLTLTKSDGRDVVDPGETIVYTIAITNVGNLTAMEVFLEDILPDQVDFIGASDGGVKPMGNSSVEWPEFTLMSGETVTRLVTVTVDSPVQADAFFITNRVTVDGHNSERVTAEDKNTLIAAPDLAISKTDGLTAVLPSQLVTYTLLISNIGNQDATGIAVIDDLPNNTSFKWANPESVFNETERVLTWTVNLLMAGESRVLTATVQVDDSMLINPLLITNTAMLTDYGVNGFDQDPINNTTADTDTIFPLPEALTSIKYANLDPVAAGERLTYIIVITNMSEINVTGLQIYDPLPAHTVFIPDSIDLYPPDAGDIGTEPPLLVDNLAIAAGQSVMVWHVVTVSKPLTNGLMINNTAKVTGIQAMVSMTSTISASPLVKIGVDGPESITAGQKATFVFTVTNIGSTWFEVDEIRDDLETRIYPVGGDDCSKDHCRDSWLDLEEAWVFTTSHTFDMPGRQTITGIVAVTDPTGVNETAEDSYSFNVVPPPSTISLIYLPVIFKDFTSAPDLIVESLLADVDLVTITVKNVGNSPVNNGFYVDIYVDPDPIPTGPEHTANDGRSDQYATWLIPSATEVLPLEVGEELTLIIGGDFYKSEYSNFLGNISVGTPIYAQVDSGSPPNGYVLELDENNIFGPVSVTLVAVEQEILPLILPESYTSSFDIKNDIRPRPRP